MLAILPRVVQVKASGGIYTHQLMNPTSIRLAFKIKSTNNDNYLLNPVFGFIEPQSSSYLVIKRTAGPVKDDFFIIQYTQVMTDFCFLAMHKFVMPPITVSRHHAASNLLHFVFFSAIPL